MATFTVTDLSDNANDTGSLRYGIDNAANGDSIVFAPQLTGTISLTSTLDVSTGLSIDGGGLITISGQNSVGDFDIDPGQGDTVSLSNLAINNGSSTGAAGAPGFGDAGNNTGGGIYATSGNISLQNDTFVNNTATGGRGSDAGQAGNGNFGSNTPDKAAGSGGNAAGAVYIDGATVTSASNLTFVNHTATPGMGGSADSANPTPGANGTAYPDSNNAVVNAAAVCYCTGTLIRTTRGDVAVEDLAVGDLAVTAPGEQRPIRWIGHQTHRLSGPVQPRSVWPVRVAAGAFGDNKPSADLYLSPGHSVCIGLFDEVLVPVQELVNGSTVAYVKD